MDGRLPEMRASHLFLDVREVMFYTDFKGLGFEGFSV